MSTISSYDSGSISALFSSLNGSGKSTGMFSGIDFNTYNSIRSGSYSKLMKAYYAKEDSETGSTTKDGKTQSMAAQKINATNVKDQASTLVDTVSDLQKNSLWNKTTKTDSEGKTTTGYDTEAIYKAVSSFVTDYNSLIEGTGNSNDDSVLKSASNMVSNTKRNSDLLKSIGITIGSDNKLKIDEDKFKSADMAAVKSVFKGQGSIAMSTSGKAASIYSSAVSQLSKLSTTNTYTANGSYSYMSAASYDKFL